MKEFKSMKKDELIRLLVESQENSLKRASAGSDSKPLTDHRSPSSAAQSSEESISFPALKSFISKAVMELKEELTLDFQHKLTSLSNEVESLRAEVAVLKAEKNASIEGLKDEILTELREQEGRKCNAMIFGAKETDVMFGTSDKQYLSNLSAAMGVSKPSFRSFFRLGSRRSHESRPRPLKIVFEDQHERDEFVRGALNLRKSDSSGNFRGIFVKPDLSPREQEADKRLRSELHRRRENGERVVIRRGRIVPDTSIHRNAADK